MICTQLTSLLGLACHPLDDAGNVVMIETPFCFNDGDAMPVFVEHAGEQVRFFDDGAVYLHFRSRGIALSTATQTRFIKTAAQAHGAFFTESGEVEVWSRADAASEGFARYIATLMDLARWESEHTGISIDAELLVEEVAHCLAAWKKEAHITRNPLVTGITGRVYTLDFDLDGTMVLVVGSHHSTTSAALHKLVDIRSLPANAKLKTLVVLDNRQDEQAAKRESMVLNGASPVMDMTVLQQHAGMSLTMQ